MNITAKDNLKEFQSFILNKIPLNDFKYKFLKNYIDNIKNGTKILYDSSTINISENGWILIIHGDILLTYGENWKKEQFTEIKDVFDLNECTNCIISGESGLVRGLTDYFKVNKYDTRIERVLYKSDDIIEFKLSNLKIELGKISETSELAEMLKQYHHEEYNGENDKTITEMKKTVYSLIKSNDIFVLKNKLNEILAFCSIINPDIGILFTKLENRKKGYGKMILSYCSKLLQEKNGEVYVMTKKHTIASNKVCKTVGYKPIFEYSSTEINYG